MMLPPTDDRIVCSSSTSKQLYGQFVVFFVVAPNRPLVNNRSVSNIGRPLETQQRAGVGEHRAFQACFVGRPKIGNWVSAETAEWVVPPRPLPAISR